MGAGAGIPEIPFAVDQVVTALDPSWNLGDIFCDNRGRRFALWQIDPALINNTFASGELCYLKAARVVTNDVSDGIDATYPIVAGVAQGSLPESTSTTTIRYGLFLIEGVATIKTSGADDIAIGENLIAIASNDGGCDGAAQSATSADAWLTVAKVGTALAADDNDANTVLAMVAVGLFH
jgi:hypothetical protein